MIMKNPGIKWLVFDADDTLLDFKGAQDRAFGAMLESLEIEDDGSYLGAYRRLNAGLWRALERGEITKEELILSRFKVFCQAVGLEGRDEIMRLTYEEELSKRGDLLVGAWELLRNLSGSFPLALASNGILWIQKRRLAESGIDRFFEEVIISEETGYEKPQKGFFDVMMDRIGESSPSRVLFIGDSLDSDMLGAVNYGLRSCWYNPDKRESQLPIDHIVTELAEIESLAHSLVI